jgi:rhodanese-related sulfurtransferase
MMIISSTNKSNMKGRSKMHKKVMQLTIIGFLLASCAAVPGGSILSGNTGYQIISVSDLEDLMDSEDFTFVNVHIPLEGNIPGTDAEIPFNEVENYLDRLPEDKDEKIVLYCRSGSMSSEASQTLVDLGYTNVFDLEGGYNAWVASGLPFEE